MRTVDGGKALRGLVFVLVIALLLGLAVAQYAGAFRGGVPVTLHVDRVGTQLNEKADVKIRGLIVGRVEQISTTGSGADVELMIDEDKADLIPANVTARLLPKTLFGEKFVSLVPPSDPGAVKLASYDTIQQDRSVAGIEVERVLDDLLPLLQAVKPQDLATTLGALSQGLQGRGDQLGRTLEQLNTLTGGLRPAIPDLQEDISQLADFSENLSNAAPDLLDALDALTTTSRTITDEAANLRALYASVGGASDDLRAFLDANKENLIRLAASGRPTLETLRRYSPELPCFFSQVTGLIPYLDQVFGKGTNEPGVHITLEIGPTMGKYIPNQDEPEYRDDRGPRCYPMIDPGPQYPPDGPFRDGAVPPAPPVGQPVGPPAQFGVEDYGTFDGTYSWDLVRGFAWRPGTQVGAGGTVKPISYDMGITNSPGEQQQIAELVGARQGVAPGEVPEWGSVLVGPLYRGAEVTFT
ncbi:MCE family protein [Pseudonocardia sp. WMMC193]|uniref:MCE family protein n=1 Tax=Pseudonocardia sp. WMMC193 TaxID=2911965 RepID=UPI001F2CD490|nr:MCE family protein [Pseudonocardia sp. WMMC193]MCF7553092.1 MCE family protein [Pseudonocardia sp. WMMC193]